MFIAYIISLTFYFARVKVKCATKDSFTTPTDTPQIHIPKHTRMYGMYVAPNVRLTNQIYLLN